MQSYTILDYAMKNITTLEKFREESRLFSFDFSLQPELRTVPPAVLDAPAVTATPDGLTIGTPAVSGTRVNVQLSEGTNGVTYLVECLVNTDGGAVIAGIGKLKILRCEQ